MRITRRHLLALSAASTAAAAVATGGLVSQWWDQPAERPYTVMNASEAAFIRAWAGAAYPATTAIPMAGDTAGLDRFFDEMLSTMPADTARLLRLLIHALDNASVLTDGAPFSSLPATTQARCFEDWIHSDIDPARSATQSLVLLVGMGWSTHPMVAPHMVKLHSCGFGR
jgi:hypothetical protein